jgi:hypothetical protein
MAPEMMTDPSWRESRSLCAKGRDRSVICAPPELQFEIELPGGDAPAA